MAEVPEHADSLRDRLADIRDQLYLAGVDLALDLAALELAELPEHVFAGIQQLSVLGTREEQLLLDAERERLALPEADRLVGLVSRGAQAPEPAT
jgi:hypothetical protein